MKILEQSVCSFKKHAEKEKNRGSATGSGCRAIQLHYSTGYKDVKAMEQICYHECDS